MRIVVTPSLSGTLVNLGSLSSSTADGTPANNSAQASVVVPVDADGDGIPDVWEIANGLNPHNASDAAADLDRDGFTNLQEYLAGTDPRNAGCKLCITDIHVSGSNLNLSFASVPGKSYALEYKNKITDALWTTQTTVSGTAATAQVIAPAALSQPKRFYRVRLLP